MDSNCSRPKLVGHAVLVEDVGEALYFTGASTKNATREPASTSVRASAIATCRLDWVPPVDTAAGLATLSAANRIPDAASQCKTR